MCGDWFVGFLAFHTNLNYKTAPCKRFLRNLRCFFERHRSPTIECRLAPGADFFGLSRKHFS
jgi:hypothetical protein